MKIFVNARFLTQPISGVQRYGIECSRKIKNLHQDVVFVAPKDILHTDIAKELNVIIIGRNTGHLWEQLDLPFYLARHKYPPLLNLANTGPIFYSNNYVTIHDLAFYHHPEWNSKKFSAWYNILMPRLAISSKHIFTVSNTIKEEIVKCYRIPASKISVAYNGISRTMLAAGRGEGVKKERIILSVGTFNARKNHEMLVEGYLKSKLSETYKLVMVGDRNKIFKDGGLDEAKIKNTNINIIPTLKETELVDLYRRAEVVASTSLYEGFGIPLLEGLFCGCKIVCSDIPVYRELYNDSAVFCAPDDVNAIANALNIIADKLPPSQQDIDNLLKLYSYKRSAEATLKDMGC